MIWKVLFEKPVCKIELLNNFSNGKENNIVTKNI